MIDLYVRCNWIVSPPIRILRCMYMHSLQSCKIVHIIIFNQAIIGMEKKNKNNNNNDLRFFDKLLFGLGGYSNITKGLFSKMFHDQVGIGCCSIKAMCSQGHLDSWTDRMFSHYGLDFVCTELKIRMVTLMDMILPIDQSGHKVSQKFVEK